ncbi:HNH endonuclease [Galbibacter sp. EGI 63066]|uniref:HNH endonuclease n=1 Tax=Galbibacter sp. EGI 63066 TaxID=2993559 RepID=UPI002248E378|nr:HNH endonuclease [Galbibacter sp. EGI 63066]MCX2679018.1 HNH endonuclease [Galbibacter sp. EGI 63066]
MKNFVALNREELAKQHYVRKASTSSDYFFSIYQQELKGYEERFGNDFNIIFYGNEDVETDYYSIPFLFVKDVLIPQNLYQKQKRWAGDIKNHVINFRVSKVKRNISGFYSLPFSLKKNQVQISVKDSNDYAIENAKREIKVRVKQSLFRNRVLNNFNGTCCVSGITENDLLVASHIVPWSEKIETRLNPSNGLCLSVLYDKLFDKGYFTLDNDYKVVITSRISELSSKTKARLLEIQGKFISSTRNNEISQLCLEFHRQNIFESFKL